MAVKITESQGTKYHLVATTVATDTTATVKTAITGGKKILFMPELSDFGSSKNVTSSSFINTDEIAKSLGSLTLGNFACDLMYDAADVKGQKDLRDMYSANSRRKMIVALNDQITPTTGNPTYIVFEVAVSSLNLGVAKDNAVMSKTTIELCSVPVIIPAT